MVIRTTSLAQVYQTDYDFAPWFFMKGCTTTTTMFIQSKLGWEAVGGGLRIWQVSPPRLTTMSHPHTCNNVHTTEGGCPENKQVMGSFINQCLFCLFVYVCICFIYIFTSGYQIVQSYFSHWLSHVMLYVSISSNSVKTQCFLILKQTFISEELNHSDSLELLDLLLTLFEECYLLGFLFVPVPVTLMQAISNWAPCWAPRQIQECKKESSTKF